MQHVASWNWEFEGGVGAFAGHAQGYARSSLVDRSVGAIHTDIGLCRLAPGGALDRHVHSFEQCAYVLGGETVVEIDDRAYELHEGDYVVFPVGLAHAWRNTGTSEARWLEVSTPQPAQPGAAREDTFFLAPRAQPLVASRPAFGRPTTRYVGHYLGTPPQREALALDGPPRGRAPAGMDTALLAYSGISIKMLVDGALGADLLTLFMVDYEPNGAAQVHDHPFEEVYVFLEGEIEGEVDGVVRTYRAGDVLFCGVGVEHGFFNTSGGRVRWLETQAPQPPRRHSYRWPAHWERLRDELAGGA